MIISVGTEEAFDNSNVFSMIKTHIKLEIEGSIFTEHLRTLKTMKLHLKKINLKLKVAPCSWIERLNVGKMAAFHKMVNKSSEMPTQILTVF